MKNCTDSFGYKIEVGMVLVPTSGEALLLGEGIVSQIHPDFSIDIRDEHYNMIVTNANPREYVRKTKKNNRYKITFYNKMGYKIIELPLSGDTVLDKMPENSSYATLCSNVFVEKNKKGNIYESKKILTFLSEETSLIHEVCEGESKCKYLEILSSPVIIPITNDYIKFKSYDEMFYTISKLIEYFNDKYSDSFENEYYIVEGEDSKKFFKSLKQKLNRLKNI